MVSTAALRWSSRSNTTPLHEIIAEGRCVTTQISQIMAVRNTKGIPVRSVRPEKKKRGRGKCVSNKPLPLILWM